MADVCFHTLSSTAGHSSGLHVESSQAVCTNFSAGTVGVCRSIEVILRCLEQAHYPRVAPATSVPLLSAGDAHAGDNHKPRNAPDEVILQFALKIFEATLQEMLARYDPVKVYIAFDGVAPFGKIIFPNRRAGEKACFPGQGAEHAARVACACVFSSSDGCHGFGEP